MTEDLTDEFRIKNPIVPFTGSSPMKCTVVILGDNRVGKTQLVHRFANGHFAEYYVRTHGVDYKNKTITLTNDVEMKLEIWDTAGEDRHTNNPFIRGAAAICVMYDVTDLTSFQNLELHLPPDGQNSRVIVKYIVGNKIEKKEKRRVSFDEGKKVADEKRYQFKEISIANNDGVTELFMSIAKAVYREKVPGSAASWAFSANKFVQK